MRPSEGAGADPARGAKPDAAESPPAEGAARSAAGSGGSPDARAEVKGYIARLESLDPEDAEEAFRELWEAPRAIIPGLILEVENPAPSTFTELKVLVIDKEHFARLRSIGLAPTGEPIAHEDSTGRFVYDIPGMGSLDYEEIATGPARGGTGLRVVLRRRAVELGEPVPTFPVGAVVRAALVNRFRSSDYPPGDHRTDLVRWWQAFYERARPRL
ncbi:MAG: hypothetical protein HY721_33145 [Planctomycetes bacterium]|nr:hypothetical protein [Planctomycetota bacterium]